MGLLAACPASHVTAGGGTWLAAAPGPDGEGTGMSHKEDRLGLTPWPNDL